MATNESRRDPFIGRRLILGCGAGKSPSISVQTLGKWRMGARRRRRQRGITKRVFPLTISVTQRNSLCLHFLTLEAEDVKGFEIFNGIDGSTGSELPSLSCGT